MTPHTHLRFAGLQRRSLSAYKLALERFLAFAHRSEYDVIDATDLDYTLAEYFNCMYQEGEPVSAAGHTLSGIKRFIPELRIQLPTASQYFRNWQRSHRPLRAVPIGWELLQAIMAAMCWDQGSVETALLLYVGLNCFLRTSEMLALQFCHLLPHHTKAELAVVKPFSKTSNGNAEILLVKDDHIWRLACYLKRRRTLTAPLWAGSRTTWARLLECFNFRPDDYTPYMTYGARRGGATWYFLETSSLDATLARGRWATSKTARSYIDDGTLTLALRLESGWLLSYHTCLLRQPLVNHHRLRLDVGVRGLS
jgi:hypothetical protein